MGSCQGVTRLSLRPTGSADEMEGAILDVMKPEPAASSIIQAAADCSPVFVVRFFRTRYRVSCLNYAPRPYTSNVQARVAATSGSKQAGAIYLQSPQRPAKHCASYKKKQKLISICKIVVCRVRGAIVGHMTSDVTPRDDFGTSKTR